MLIDPYTVFERARQVWAAQRYPGVVSYTLDVAASRDGAPEHRHYHAYWSASDNITVIKPPVSDEQLTDPYKPSAGVNFMGWNIGGPRVGIGDRDFIGPPLLSPNYSFGMNTYVPPDQRTPAELVEEIRREYHDPAPQKVNKLAQQSGLKTIAIESASAHTYHISLVGIEPDGANRDYHLALQPLQDPLKYRLRDLWIDTATFVTRRARIGANFTDAATEQIPWMVRFQQIGGATYIASEDAERPIAGFRGLMYSTYRVSFGTPQTAEMPPYAPMTSVTGPLVEP